MKLEMKLVLEQLEHIGMLETIRIRKLGYPIRYKYSLFISRYRLLIGQKPAFLEMPKDITQFMLSKLSSTKYKQMYQIGWSKVFLKEALDNYLEQQCGLISRRAALVIQRNLRMFVARQKYRKLRASVICFQRLAKAWLER